MLSALNFDPNWCTVVVIVTHTCPNIERQTHSTKLASQDVTQVWFLVGTYVRICPPRSYYNHQWHSAQEELTALADIEVPKEPPKKPEKVSHLSNTA